jgi:hypothetical protein
MSERMNDRVFTSLGSGRRTGPVLALLAAAGWASACLSEVPIPPCVQDHSCASGSGGDAGEDDGGGTSSRGGATAAGAPSLGGAAEGGADASAGSPPSEAGAGGGGCDGCGILPLELVAPCAGQPYHTALTVTGGVPPYTWQLTTAAEGWSISAHSEEERGAELTATAPAKGQTTLTVRAIDSRGLDVHVEYRTRARDACWLAYTAVDAESSKLALVDALSHSAPVELDHNTHVYDFQFSPDGRYLAYRYGADLQFPHGRHLALVELSTPDEQPLLFAEDAVTAYAWSPDGSILAVAFAANADKFLGGVRLPAVGTPGSPTALEPIEAFVEENLAWVGQDVVAYHAQLLPDLDNPGQFLPDNPDHLSTPFYARLGTSGFAASQFTFDSFEPSVFLQPAPAGFWIVNSLMTFFPMTDKPTDSVPHYDATLVAPSGRYSAILGETLQLLSAHQGPPSAVASSKVGESCPMPLAWSRQDKLACVADIDHGPGLGRHGEVRFFDVEADSELLSMSSLLGSCKDDISVGAIGSCTALRQGYGYGISEAGGAPRGFSPSGRWFAFTRADLRNSYLYWADLETVPITLSGSLLLIDGPVRLAFSPDSRKVAVQTTGGLFVKSLSGVSPETHVTGPLATIDKCSEEFPTAPHRYCGDTSLDAQFKWAPDSVAVAYLEGGLIKVVDTSKTGSLQYFRFLPALCVPPQCSGDFEFQPPPEN